MKCVRGTRTFCQEIPSCMLEREKERERDETGHHRQKVIVSEIFEPKLLRKLFYQFDFN